MLIYNHKKEFLGIDESDLKALNFSNLTELLFEAADFADLFEKSVGYVHNFKHVHWIDYIVCDDSGVKQKVIIRAKGRSFTATLDIQTLCLVESPQLKSYIVNLLNIKSLSDSKNEQFKTESVPNLAPQIAEPVKVVPAKIEPAKVEPAKIEPVDGYDPYKPKPDADADDENIFIPINIDIDIDDLQLENKPDEIIKPKEPKTSKQPPPKPIQTAKTEQIDENDEYKNYRYDSQTASEALGLPLDLIEEFVQDFIVQANSFKKDLYQAARDKDMSNLKMLAHKLKGVAANLRIENSLSVLTYFGTINEDEDAEAVLNKFFRTLDRLASKEMPEESLIETDTKDTTDKIDIDIDDDDDFILSLKDEESIEAEENLTDALNTTQTQDNIDIIEMDDEFNIQLQETPQNESKGEELPELAASEEYDYNITMEEASDADICYNRELVAKSIGLDINSFNKLLEEYLQTSYQLCQDIVASAKKSDFNSFKKSAVELKGMSNNMKIHELDDELNSIIISNDNKEIEKTINTIKTKIDQISNTKDKQ